MPMILGEHPTSEGGAPVTIGWEAEGIRKIPLDLYELYRSDDPVRSTAELRIDATERAHILLGAGYSLAEMAEAAEAAQKTRKQRQESVSSQKMEFFHVVAESAHRKLARVVGGTRKMKVNAAA